MNLEIIKKLLKDASKAYYSGELPALDNEQFDRLSELVNYSEVGYKAEGLTGKHLFPMYSLNKCYVNEKALPDEITRRDTIKSIKLDGAAISLLSLNGELVQALTRGDGKVGNIITDKIPFIKGIPFNKILESSCLQITGEVVAKKELINSRNYVSGALALKDIEQFKTRNLVFIAYDIQPKLTTWYDKDLNILEDLGFNTILSKKIDFSEYPTDGYVLRVNNNDDFENLGYTSHHPRGAIAIKERKESVITELLDVIWQVGKSGRVTPVAILKPIDINGAMVSKATLNNVRFLESLDLYIGCNVEVIRSGEIIPTIVSRA